MAECKCKWCTEDHPKYKAMMVETDPDVLHKYIEELFENWCMADEEIGWKNLTISDLKEEITALRAATLNSK